MVQILQASDLSLHEVKERFDLSEVDDDAFFWEWQGDRSPITDEEKRWLDQIKADFLALSEYPLHEEVIKLFVLAPLLSMAGLARLPFLVMAEKQIEIELSIDSERIRGRIDLLVLYQHLWAIVIESKSKRLDVMEALPQALVAMIDSPNQTQPTYGLLTNGYRFIFIKLIRTSGSRSQSELSYALSEDFSLQRKPNQLWDVLQILKRMAQIVQQSQRENGTA